MSGFGFLAPLLLGLAALSIPIIMMYMLRLRRTEVPISSTFLWQQLLRDREANAPWQRLRFNWLLLLQLLILAALVLALARPFNEVKTITTGRTVVLLDASASMNAEDMDEGRTRFEAAQSLALETVDTLGPDDTMTVIRVAEIPEVLVAASRDKGLLRRAIGDAQPSQTSADWQAAFALAAAGGRGVDALRVVVLSDGGLPGDLPEIPGDFSYVRIGESAENVAITALSTRALPDEPPQLFARVTNFGEQDTETIFAIELDGNLFNANRYAIPAGQSVDIIVEDLPADLRQLKATVNPPSSADVPDHLAADNVAHAVFQQATGGDVLVITESNIFLERIFSLLPGTQLTQRLPDEGLPSREFDLMVLDSWLPPDLPTSGDLLIINPPASTPLFTLGDETTDTQVNPDTGGVDPNDPRTRYLDFSNVAVRKMQVIETPDWATPLVMSESGLPLVLAGEVEGRQVALIAFDLHDSNLPLQIQWPILITSLMEWFQPRQAVTTGGSLPPGTPVTIRPSVEADTVRITAPDGEDFNVPLTDVAEIIFGETDQLGLYTVEVRAGNQVVQRDAFAVNLFDPRESHIQPVETLQIQTEQGLATIGSSQGEEIGRREWWPYLAYLGLLLLGIEWWYYHRSQTNVRQAAGRVTFGQERRSPAPWWRFWARGSRS